MWVALFYWKSVNGNNSKLCKQNDEKVLIFTASMAMWQLVKLSKLVVQLKCVLHGKLIKLITVWHQASATVAASAAVAVAVVAAAAPPAPVKAIKQKQQQNYQ